MIIKNDLVHVTELIIQSDNAKCYKCNELLIGLQNVVKCHGLKLLMMVHSGVQDGKGPIDGHFSTAMKNVTRYCNSGNEISTGKELVHDLQANGGVTNSVATLVVINRNAVANAIGRVQKGNTRCHEIHFKKNKLIKYEYSGIGKGIDQIISDLTADDNTNNSNDCDDEDKSCDSDEYENRFVEDCDEEDDNDGHSGNHVTARGIFTKCVVFGDPKIRERIRKKSERNDKTTLDELQCEEDELDDNITFQCPSCSRQFLERKYFNVHTNKCRGSTTGSKDLRHFALSYSKQRIDKQQVNITVMMTDTTDIKILDCAQDTPLSDGDISFFKRGWDLHPPHGKSYGRKYIEPFKHHIEDWFKLGMVDKSVKMSPAKMVECLVRKYPGRIYLPSESEIRQVISVLVNKQREGIEISLAKSRGIVEPYFSTVNNIFMESQGEISPTEGWNQFLVHHPMDNEESMESRPSQKQVKSKISSMKSVLNKTGVLPFI